MTGTFKKILIAAATITAIATPAIASAAVVVTPVTRTTTYTLKSLVSAINPFTPATFNVNFTLAETNGVYSLTAVSGTNGTTTFGLNNVGLVSGLPGLTIGGTLSGVNAIVLPGTNDFYANFVPDLNLPFDNTLVVSSIFSNTTFIPSVGPLYLTTGATVVTPVAAVPEPATWALMLVGFGMVGGAVRYRRKRTTVVYA